jgi:hypothetical protein
MCLMDSESVLVCIFISLTFTCDVLFCGYSEESRAAQDCKIPNVDNKSSTSIYFNRDVKQTNAFFLFSLRPVKSKEIIQCNTNHARYLVIMHRSHLQPSSPNRLLSS